MKPKKGLKLLAMGNGDVAATNFELTFYGVALTIMAVVVGFQIRYYLRRFASRRWPNATATIKRGMLGTVGRGAGAGFFEYEFTVEGVQHSGKFAITCNLERAEKLEEKLDGLPISIKYHPADPSVSLLVDFYDPRFDGEVATQNPYWYMNARQKDSFLALGLTKK